MNADVENHIRQNHTWSKLPANVKQVGFVLPGTSFIPYLIFKIYLYQSTGYGTKSHPRDPPGTLITTKPSITQIIIITDN